MKSARLRRLGGSHATCSSRGTIPLVLLAVLCGTLPASPTMHLARPYHHDLSYSPSQPERVTFFAPGEPDFLFPEGKRIRLEAAVQGRAIAAEWTLRPNQQKEVIARGQAEAEPGGGFFLEIPGADLPPGFYGLMLKVDFGDEERSYPCTFGYRVEAMEGRPSAPPDFEAFWEQAVADFQKAPLRAETGPWIEFQGPEIETYLRQQAFLPSAFDPEGVRFDSVRAQDVVFDAPDGSQIHGRVAAPPVSGKLPALLILPGAGKWNWTRPYPLEDARHGYLALDVSLEPVPEVGDSVADPRLADKDFQLVARAYAALRYLRSRPDVDPERIVVAGMSQGARLALILAALDPNLAGAVASIPYKADIRYPERLEQPTPKDWRPADYTDLIHFAPGTGIPVLISAGLLDRVSPVSSVYNYYRNVGSERKAFVPMPRVGHFVTFEFDRRAWRWIEELTLPAVADGQ